MAEGNGVQDIATLIGATEDAATRGILVVLHRISKTVQDNQRFADAITDRMDSNQKIFNAHIDTFTKHAETETKMFQRIIAVWKVVAFLLPTLGTAIVGTALWILVKQINVNESQGLMIAKLQAEMAEVRANQQRNTAAIQGLGK
jgi:cell division protein FtsB